MDRIFNFSAGPAALPQAVLEQARDELVNWHGCGMSVMEMSHRGKEYMSIQAEAEADLRELMGIPADYKVLFLQGGASAQFAMVPMNLYRGKTSADYLNTGEWSKKAISEARKYGAVNVVATSEDKAFTYAPAQSAWKLDPNAAYVHYTPNETIGGVEIFWTPDTGAVPLVADMSSNILSREIDVSKFGLIYAGAQKNIGPAGLTIVIVREDLLGQTIPGTPTMFDYKIAADNDSMYNTPPTYGIYIAGLVFQWLKRQGGLAGIAAVNAEKARILYECIENSAGFYANPVDPDCRSRMNVPFTLAKPALDAAFLAESKAAGLASLKGHKSVGGMRASIYNAVSLASVPLDGVRVLVDFMNDFVKRNG